MISTDYPEIVVSDISLAVFEDSGWYNVNYFTGGLFKTGKGEGCAFLQEKCLDTNGKSRFPLDFCEISNDDFCSPGLIDRGHCYIQYNWNIPSEYKYFSNQNYGGFESADYCPTSYTFSRYFGSRCDSNGNFTYLLPNGIYQKFGPTSFCFRSSLIYSNMDWMTRFNYGNILSARCLEVSNCDDSTLSYTIDFGKGIDFTCENANDTYMNK